MKNFTDHEAAPTVLECCLRDIYYRRDANAAMGVFSPNEQSLPSMRDQGAEAFAIVLDGHVHLGVIHHQALSHVLSFFYPADELCVHYEYGGVLVHASPFRSSHILISAAGSRTIWALKDFGVACVVTKASLYALIADRLVLFGTKPVRSFGREVEGGVA